jgi:hypothetical protein
MCTCNNCNEVTLFKGTNGVGVSSTVDNEDGTFTIYYTDGTSFTSEDLTGPTGATGSTGATGASGAAGTNAFKFIKDFTSNLESGTCTIIRGELISCTAVPNGCLFGSVAPGFNNLQVQVWYRPSSGPFGNLWTLANSANSGLSVAISNLTGDITCTFAGSALSVVVRVVVIA